MNRAPTWVRPAANRYSYVVTRSRPYPLKVVAVSGWERQRDSGCDVIASLPRRRGLKRKEPGLAAGLRCMKLSVKLRSCNQPRGQGHRRQRTCR